MKLKTLKDLEEYNEGQYKWIVSMSELREEAIRWVIDGAKKKKNMFKMFMDFFNITEENLE